MSIRTVVVDDEKPARVRLTELLQREPDVEMVGTASDGRQALDLLRRVKPDLLFLDVQMPDCDGFDVLETLGGDAPRAIVFVTAYDQYALKAFEVEALDYLLKPFDDARFFRALARAKEQIRQRQGTGGAFDRLIVKSAGRVSFLRIGEIDWIEAADYYACLHVAGKTHLLRRSMSELERAPFRFIETE